METTPAPTAAEQAQEGVAALYALARGLRRTETAGDYAAVLEAAAQAIETQLAHPGGPAREERIYEHSQAIQARLTTQPTPKDGLGQATG